MFIGRTLFFHYTLDEQKRSFFFIDIFGHMRAIWSLSKFQGSIRTFGISQKNIKSLCQVYYRWGMPPVLAANDETTGSRKPAVK